MMLFKRANSIVGWACFAIAVLTYLLTIEPSQSLWDCGEFIATAYKLEVGHPPGNPVFLLIARFFTMFAFGNAELVPVMVNVMSAVCSAFTILLLFWTITHLARKLFTNSTNISLGNTIAILGAGIIGALAYTFSDTFWFSAVEGEVYAMSSLCTAATFWAILKWEDRVGEPNANRWLMLLAFIIGLAIGVHLLNLLAIPAVGMVYYFKLYKPTWKGGIAAFILSCFIVLFFMLMIPGIPTIASWFELLFVNGFGLPYNSGTVVGFLAILAVLFWVCYLTHKRGKVLLNTISLFLTLVVIGFSAYALNIIRASANPPINENAPDNVFAFISYLNRDQYGAPPLLSGRTYATDVVDYKKGSAYVKKNGRYEKIPSTSYVYSDKGQMLLPRMHDAKSVEDYTAWAKLNPRIVNLQEAQALYGRGYLKQLSPQEAAQYRLSGNEPYFRYIDPPTMGENLRFLFDYQLSWMYWRYFFWNFAGRQNDIQGHGGPMYGNWESGIGFVDNALIAGKNDQPDFLKNNKGKNHYYMLPFILGVIGLIYQLLKDKRQWLVVALLFFFTGIAIVLYLNQTPIQPRERDYAYAGSFYAYTIWIGLAVLAFYELLQTFLKRKNVICASLAVLICLPAPIIMAQQNWDDHNRAGRYMARDISYNYLMSCEPNAILFTVGDNDTFPLWYMQEVEGLRTDVRVVNLSLLAADWYIDQMKSKVYDSEPLPISLTRDSYIGEENNSLEVRDNSGGQSVSLKQLIAFVGDPKNKAKSQYSYEPTSYLPRRNAILPVNRTQALAGNTIKLKDTAQVEDTITFSIPGSYIIKPQLIIYDILANNDWKRPVYFTSTTGDSNVGLRDYLQYNGFTYKLVPIKTIASGNELAIGRIDTEWLYDFLMNTCRWGNMDDTDIYVDYFYITTLVKVLNVRGMFSELAHQLIREGENAKASEVINKVMLLMPEENFPYCSGSYLNDMSMVSIIDALYKLGQNKEASALADRIASEMGKNLSYFLPISPDLNTEAQVTILSMKNLYYVALENGNSKVVSQLEEPLKRFRLIQE